MTAAEPSIVWLDEDGATPERLGGKFGSLAEMVRAGFAVPPGFGVTTAAYRAFVQAGGLDERIGGLLGEAPPDDLDAIERASAEIARLIRQAPMPARLEDEIRAGYAELESRTGTAGVPVAVRSSGVLEDTAGASFAGQYDTYLWIQGADAVLEHVRRCWSGLFGPQVLTYHPHGEGVRHAERAAMCVGVQQMIAARAAGVAFTLDPVTGDRSKIVIEAVWGLGEGVVSGDVSPDRFRVDKITLEVLSREIAEKAGEHRLDPASGSVRLVDVEPERRGAASLDDDLVRAIASEAKRIERHRQAPQDIEWAVDEEARLHVVQVRPETVWSRRPAKRIVEPGQGALDRVLSSFIRPGGR
ncbi:PEP/pyruvate-binding domain-containing protein [Capillimicrobium parvum]|uniref:Phosphoenolpyruvate synthase n=1 Tax=Capillimicrobium parvum TaxID=2884022 RepID=A0A9E6XWR8_9ACTN|nr:PEP/pyruvate-binding domain-containing protein [Capillimicrobium parvum]UGS35936.1 Phosphoenolpyruvate synthase [Capillimicrobium parvum]